MNTDDDIIALVHRESRLLDAMRLDEWLALYTEDARYWIPIDEAADPELDSSIVYDNHFRLQMRVEQLMRQKRLAQTPQSSSVRMISNLSVRAEQTDRAVADYVLLVMETRSGDWRQRGLGGLNLFPAHGQMACVRTPEGWRISSKKLLLINRHQPIEGLSFIL